MLYQEINASYGLKQNEKFFLKLKISKKSFFLLNIFRNLHIILLEFENKTYVVVVGTSIGNTTLEFELSTNKIFRQKNEN